MLLLTGSGDAGHGQTISAGECHLATWHTLLFVFTQRAPYAVSYVMLVITICTVSLGAQPLLAMTAASKYTATTAASATPANATCKLSASSAIPRLSSGPGCLCDCLHAGHSSLRKVKQPNHRRTGRSLLLEPFFRCYNIQLYFAPSCA